METLHMTGCGVERPFCAINAQHWGPDAGPRATFRGSPTHCPPQKNTIVSSRTKRLLFLDALNVRANRSELLLDLFIAAIDVVNAVNAGGSLGDQAREHQCRRGAQVAGHDAGALQFLDALDDGGGA